MRYYTIRWDGMDRLACSQDGKTLYIQERHKDLNSLICSGGRGETDERLEKVEIIKAKLEAPIPYPLQDIICLGMNYAKHADEAARFSSDAFGGERHYPVFFSKRVNRALAPEHCVPSYPGLVDGLDYECELAVVIGRDAKNVKKEEVKDYIFGYTIINDISARNLQTRHKQWYFGKSLDGFTPMGPCIISADEVSFPPDLSIQCQVNGELRQNARTSDLITGIEEIIGMLSEGMTLRAGTIIATGTPAGVGMGYDLPRFLQKGDEVICRIEKIGDLRNVIE